MDRRYEQLFTRQRALIGQSEKEADARRAYLLDEAAYALSEQLLPTGGRLAIPLPDEYGEMLSRFSREEKSFLTLRLYEHLRTREKEIKASDFLFPEEVAAGGEHIVYVQNFYTERAYEIFAEAMKNPTVSYAPDFINACAEVGEGLADLCILPFRDERWATFHSFSKMPEDYGLTVCAVCTVERTDGEIMRLSLCGRGCRVPEDAKELAVEFFFSSHDGEDFEDIRHLVGTLGGQTVFAQALPDRYTAMTSWRITYKLEASALAPLLLGRRLLSPESELFGIYKMPSLSDREA